MGSTKTFLRRVPTLFCCANCCVQGRFVVNRNLVLLTSVCLYWIAFGVFQSTCEYKPDYVIGRSNKFQVVLDKTANIVMRNGKVQFWKTMWVPSFTYQVFITLIVTSNTLLFYNSCYLYVNFSCYAYIFATNQDRKIIIRVNLSILSYSMLLIFSIIINHMHNQLRDLTTKNTYYRVQPGYETDTAWTEDKLVTCSS